MNQNVNQKLGEMASSIDPLYQTPSRCTTKYQNAHLSHDNDITLQS
jgi:hypothetical protein